LTIFVGGGVAYVKFYGSTTDTKESNAPVAPTPDLAIPKPPKLAANAPENAAVHALTSPVKAGENTSITVKTNPESVCSINVSYNNVPAKDSGLVTKPSDPYGSISWTWTVDKTAPPGKWPVKVTCVYTPNKKSGVVIGDLQVTK
jgi:hypothetical protein